MGVLHGNWQPIDEELPRVQDDDCGGVPSDGRHCKFLFHLKSSLYAVIFQCIVQMRDWRVLQQYIDAIHLTDRDPVRRAYREKLSARGQTDAKRYWRWRMDPVGQAIHMRICEYVDEVSPIVQFGMEDGIVIA